MLLNVCGRANNDVLLSPCQIYMRISIVKKGGSMERSWETKGERGAAKR
jgi:hypothetical protein